MTASLVPSAVDPEVSSAIQIYEQLKPLKDALGVPNLTDTELHLFAIYAARSGLDPFTRQIYAIKRGGRVTYQTGIDGYRATAESKGGGQYAGSDEPTFEACDCGKEDSPPDHPKLARVVVHRILTNGHVVNQVGVARWHELKPAHVKPQASDQYLDAMWWRMPFNQLAKCAEAAGLRKAFPRWLGGIYIAEEMDQAEVIEGTATPAARTTVSERLAERRALHEGRVQAEPLPGSDATPVEAGPTHPAPASGIVEEAKRMFGQAEKLPAEPGSDLADGLGLIR